MFYRSLGQVPRRRHTQFRTPEGALLHEEMQGEEGFSWNQSFLYHRNPPTAITAAETIAWDDRETRPQDPLLPRHLRTQDVPAAGDPASGRKLLLSNSDFSLLFAAANTDSPLYRNAVGDELIHIQSGSAILESPYGPLAVGAGDYVVIPTSTTHRWVLTSPEIRMLVIEASGGGHIRVPKGFLSPLGQLLDGSPFTERDLRVPEQLPPVEVGPAEVHVRSRSSITRYTYAYHPFDVVGWDGYNFPYALNIADYMPRTGALHLPPPTYATFTGPGFVVCSFVPRMFDYHPDAVKVPYAHANVDSDEVLFYTDGDFMSRAGSGISAGSISLHPAGFVHGPQPGSAERTMDAKSTEETAVMIDTFQPVRLGAAIEEINDPAYAWSWARGAAAVS